MAPIDKIQRGLESRERLRRGVDSSSLIPLLGSPRTTGSLLDMLRVAQGKADRYREFSSSIRNSLAAFKDKKTEEIARIAGLSASQRSEIVKHAVSEKRKELLAVGLGAGVSFEDRERIRAELIEITSRMRAVKANWDSPVSAVMRETLGSEKRRAFAADVKNAGPQEIDALLRHSVALGGDDGKALAAALFQRIDKLAETNPDVRNRITINKGDVADALGVGRECRAAQQAIEAVEILHDEIALESVELVSGESSRVARDSLHMRKRNFDAQFPADPEPKE